MAGSDEDELTQVLALVGKDRRPETRPALANSIDTRAFLDVALEVLRQDLLDDQNNYAVRDPRASLMRAISRSKLVSTGQHLREAGRIPARTMTTTSQFRDRWRYMSDFADDVIAYLFRPYPYNQHIKIVRETIVSGDLREASFGTLIDELSAAEISLGMHDTTTSLQTAIQRALPNHPQVKSQSAAMYRVRLPKWASIYELIGTRYGFRLRSDFTWDDLAEILNAVVEGVGVRAMIDTERLCISNGKNILSAAIRLMIPSIMEGGGRQIDVDAMFPVSTSTSGQVPE